MKIAASILSAKSRMSCVEMLNETEADYIHIDAMDGRFVSNYQLPVDEVNKIGMIAKKPLDIHLMMVDPKQYIGKLTIQNIDSIIVHIEINNLDEVINLIRSYGYKVGLAIKPNTDINLLDNYLDVVDKILVMSVEPGFGGQRFLDSTVGRIREIRRKKEDVVIEVDGGINDSTIGLIYRIADIAVVGSYITNSNNYNEAINNLKN